VIFRKLLDEHGQLARDPSIVLDILQCSGFAAWYVEQPSPVKFRLHGNPATPGVEHSEAVCEYPWNSHAAAIASDTYGVEVFPADMSAEARPFGFPA
jgi:hypothetical protein